MITYKASGVDIEKADRLIDELKVKMNMTFNPYVLNPIGGFASLLTLPKEYEDPVIVTSTDGVGTKLKIAQKLKRHSTVGIDLVAMCVNDILTYGARPLFFLDYFACGTLEENVYREVISGICEGCTLAGCALVGGETAEMPSFYRKGEYDLAGFAMGVVEKKRIVDGSSIEEGDAVIGIASNGLHSNGFSLVRKLILEVKRMSLKQKVEGLETTLGEELLKPTKIYVRPVMEILERFRVKGMAHITGGGIPGNLKRIIPSGLIAELTIEEREIPFIFRFIKELGDLPYDEMFSTFNMGVGYILVVKREEEKSVIELLSSIGERAYSLGTIEKTRSEKKVKISVV